MRGAPPRVAVTGIGLLTSVARDVGAFSRALRDGSCGIDFLRRPRPGIDQPRIGAEMVDFDWRSHLETTSFPDKTFVLRSQRILNRAPDSTRLSACAAAQALADSRLLESGIASERIGLIVAGSNIHQRFIHENGARFRADGDRIAPAYALSFFDSGQVGCLSEIFGLHGLGYTVGGASASGNVALCQGWHWVRHGVVDACVVVGASADFSEVEMQGFSVLGAACGDRYQDLPKKACRPFDRDRDGFVFGEGTGVVVLENSESALARKASLWGELLGGSMVLDGNSLPNPSSAGEVRAMRLALQEAGVQAGDIGYVNAHGSSSVLGDAAECEALVSVFGDHLQGILVNSTKSITGHCMFAAGVVEFIACLIQMNEGFLHPNLNLENPVEPRIRFAGPRAAELDAEIALSNGLGFGGINSSLIIGRGPAG